MLRSVRRSNKAGFRAAVVLVPGALLGACRSERTQIVVVVDTDYQVPAGLDSVVIRVTNPRGGAAIEQPILMEGARRDGCVDTAMGARFCVPLSFLVTPSAGRVAGTPVEVQVDGYRGDLSSQGNRRVSRTARLNFAAGQTLRLPMFLTRACEGVACPSDFTCGEGGRCISVNQPPGVSVIDPRTGNEFDAGPPIDAGPSPDVTVPEDSGVDATLPIDAAADGPSLDVPLDTGVEAGPDVGMEAGTPFCQSPSCPALSQIVAGANFTCARYASGRVACWGANDVGQLGRMSVTPLVAGAGGLPDAQFVGSMQSIVALGAGANHACAGRMIPANRDVFCWGNNSNGLLGVDSMANAVRAPQRVAGWASADPPAFLALGLRSIYAVVGRDVFAWGDNADGALGVAMAPATVTTPALVGSSMRVRVASARDRGMCWLDNRTAVCVGVNAGQRFGTTAANGAILATPTPLVAAYSADALALSDSFACTVDGGAVSCWGENRASGVLGRIPAMGDAAIAPLPRAVTLPQPIAEVVAGGDFVLARTNSGRVFCWGSNVEGTCATGTMDAGGAITPAATGPVEVVFPAGFNAPARLITAGDSHACVEDTMHVVWCWGRNSHAQVGRPWSDAPAARRFITPVPVRLPN